MTSLADLIRKAGLESTEPEFIDIDKLPMFASDVTCSHQHLPDDGHDRLLGHQCTREPGHKGRHACQHGVHDA